MTTELYKDLEYLYSEYYKTLNHFKTELKKTVDKQDFSNAAILRSKVDMNETDLRSIKNILQKHFSLEVERSIEDTNKIYEKESEFSRAAWDMYGSELAGDFNKKEVAAQKRLYMLKSILEK